MSRRRGARAALLALALVLAALWTAVPALAHARLDGSDPPAGATLATAPAVVQLHFDEQISPQFSLIHVLDRGRNDVSIQPISQVPGDKATLRVTLLPKLHNGSYTVVWRAVSAVDGHLTQGSYVFTLAQTGAAPDVAPVPTETPAPGAAGPAGSEGAPPTPPLRWLWRALGLIAAAGLLGAPLFSTVVLASLPRSALDGLAAPLGRRLAGLVAGLAVLVLAALAADMLYQVAVLDNTDVPGAFGNLPLAGQIVLTTAFGAYWALKVVAALALLGYGLWRRASAGALEWPAAVLNGGFLFAGEALGSHEAAARSLGGLPLGVLSDLLHLLAAGAWVGGLLYLAVVLLPGLRRGTPAAAEHVLGLVVPRYSTLALISVAVLVVSGVGNLALHTLDLPSVVDSDYGRLLILKHLLFLPLLALIAANTQVLRPRLLAALRPAGPEAAGQAGRFFARLATLELGLGLAILCCAAGLTLLPPPIAATIGETPSSQTPGPPAPLPPTPGPVLAAGSSSVGGVRFELSAQSASSGDRFTIRLTRLPTGTVPLTDVFKLQARITPQDVDAPGTSLALARAGPADPDQQVYTATGQVLTLAGSYQLTAELLRTGSPDLRAGFRIDVGDDGSLRVTSAPVVRAIVTTQPNPPQVGPATVVVRVLDGQDQPLPDSLVTVTAIAPAGGPPLPALAAARVAGGQGEYRAAVTFATPGTWLLLVRAARPGAPTVTVDTAVQVPAP